MATTWSKNDYVITNIIRVNKLRDVISNDLFKEVSESYLFHSDTSDTINTNIGVRINVDVSRAEPYVQLDGFTLGFDIVGLK